MTAPDEVAAIRAAAALLLDRAAVVPPGPWHWERVLERLVLLDQAKEIIARIPDSVSGGEDAAAWLTLRDPRSARLEAAMLNAIADEAGRALKLWPDAVSAELAWRVTGYTEALELARYLLEEAS